jgi:spore coat polysaccharide biosynthesis predicted glycosyltransferase SpsG
LILKAKRNILICPLEWGLGHAGRMIPLARILQEDDNTIFIGAGTVHQQFLRSELKGAQFIDFMGFRPSYSKILPQYLALFFQIPALIYHILKEHIKIGRIISEYNIDIVISDNRFGLWSRKAKTVYVTHQIRIPFPQKLRFLEWAGVYFHRFFIKKYDLCFIPDLPGEINLAGRLAHSVKLPGNARFIGILSRFSDVNEKSGSSDIPLHNTLMLSGPEPQRSMIREIITSLQDINTPPLVILEGRPGIPDNDKGTGRIITYNHLPAAEMKRMMQGSAGIIARAGYTSIMELVSLDCSALLVPTPGQTEQEYLASHLSEKGWFTMIRQKDIKEGFPMPQKNASWPGDLIEKSRILLAIALKELSDQ